MPKLKSYAKHVFGGKEKEKTKSGVACSEKKCSGEMMVWNPTIQHPQLPLCRANCSKCGWRGWV